MGTRSLVHIVDAEFSRRKTPILTIYRQCDGYLTGMGKDLQEFLKNFTVVNGYGSGMHAGTHANGAGCLAAQLVAHLKDSLGNVYIYPPNSKDCGEEYVYTITVRVGNINIRAFDVNRSQELFNGPVSRFDPVALEKALNSDEE